MVIQKLLQNEMDPESPPRSGLCWGRHGSWCHGGEGSLYCGQGRGRRLAFWASHFQCQGTGEGPPSRKSASWAPAHALQEQACHVSLDKSPLFSGPQFPFQLNERVGEPAEGLLATSQPDLRLSPRRKGKAEAGGGRGSPEAHGGLPGSESSPGHPAALSREDPQTR